LGRFAPTPRAFGATGLTAPPSLPRSPQVDVAALEAQIAEKAARAREEAEYDRWVRRAPPRSRERATPEMSAAGASGSDD
jgi:hypothetical protein